MSVSTVFSSLNPMVSAILRSRLHCILSLGLAEITVTGRRSGRHYSFPVGFQWDGEEIVILVSDAPSKRWWRNYRESWPMRLLIRGRYRQGAGLVVAPDSDEFAALCERAMRRVPGLSRAFGVEYSRRRGLDDRQRAQLRQSVVAIRVRLAAAATPEPG